MDSAARFTGEAGGPTEMQECLIIRLFTNLWGDLHASGGGLALACRACQREYVVSDILPPWTQREMGGVN